MSKDKHDVFGKLHEIMSTINKPGVQHTLPRVGDTLPPTLHVVGFMYDQGIGVKQDFGEAVRFYRKAADQGDVSAQW